MIMSSEFECYLSVPAQFNWASAARSIAGVKSAALIIDTAFCTKDVISRTSAEISRHQRASISSSRIGLRFFTSDLDINQSLIASISESGGTLVLASETSLSIRDCEEIRQYCSEAVDLLLEVKSKEEFLEIKEFVGYKGLIIRGSESGGFCGQDSSFILLQQMLRSTNAKIFVHGGIGVHTASGCRSIGAAGVVLSDELLLMPDIGIRGSVRSLLANLDGHESALLHETGGNPARILSRKGCPVLSSLTQKALGQEAINRQDPAKNLEWIQSIKINTYWDHNMNSPWPVGQGIGLAKYNIENYNDLRMLVVSLLGDAKKYQSHALHQPVIRANSPLALANKTKYPIVQGPMTRVSDTPEFARAVAEAGGLPMIALALMKGAESEKLLKETSKLLENLPWGVGLLGFAPQKLRDQQINAIKSIKPRFAVIAGGRPDQAKSFEEHGIKAYLHVPTPALLQLFISQGARRFIFEGRECGGHIGPMSSFVLWQSMVHVLLSEEENVLSQIEVLFAGGIHDSVSSKFISALTIALERKKVKVGVLVGTAYLYTKEAVASGAILPQYQEAALKCTHTINLETGVGHASRCAVTPFAEEFLKLRSELISQGLPKSQMKDRLEHLSLGRLRLASKGLERKEDGLIKASLDEVSEKGMVMIGQVAQLRDSVTTISNLHSEICSVENTQDSTDPKCTTDQKDEDCNDIAVVGMSSILPGSESPDQYWSNIIEKRDCLTEIPIERWDWRLFYDPDKSKKDKIYSKWGGFIDDVLFDPIAYGIPPVALKSIEPLQLLSLEAVKRALEDAGYWDKPFDREHTSVILGVGGGLADLGQQYATRSELPLYVENIDKNSWHRLPEWTEESFPGILLNVIAGRIANRFNFGGINQTVDAACASSLAAIEQAVKELQSGSSHMVIAGGVDTIQTPFAYYCFSKSQALSPSGKCRSFDKNADGIAISEGLAIVVLKRLSDAKADGDRIYCVIKGAAGSSDGRALGMTAPRSEGQIRALERAYIKAGFDIDKIGHYEAHGTGTAVGDRTELDTLTHLLNKTHAQKNSCAVGSVKSMIGHTKSTAGAAGLIKSALSLHYKVLPPTNNVTEPIGSLNNHESPAYLLSEAKPWFSKERAARRAGVSAFGFGGTNFHVVLEENFGAGNDCVGQPDWPYELIIFAANNKKQLLDQLNEAAADIENLYPENLRCLSYDLNLKTLNYANPPLRLALVCSSIKDLATKLKIASQKITHENTTEQENIFFADLGVDTPDANIAFVYPGQGSQYLNMYRDSSLYIEELRDALESFNQDKHDCLTDIIYPPSIFSSAIEDQYLELLRDPELAQAAVGAISIGLSDFLNRVGIIPNVVVGHSFGEISALSYSGSIRRNEFVELVRMRGQHMRCATKSGSGSMAAIIGPRSITEELLEKYPDLKIANFNSPTEVVVAGNHSSITELTSLLNFKGNTIKQLAVAGAFHTPLMSEAANRLGEGLRSLDIQQPLMNISSNRTGCLHSSQNDIRDEIKQAITSPVLFQQQIHNLYNNGTNVFIEVGPKQVLSRLIKKILGDKPHTVLSMDSGQGGLAGVLSCIAKAYINGILINPCALYRGRLKNRIVTCHQHKSQSQHWLVSGGSVRRNKNDGYKTGRIPPLNANQFHANTFSADPSQLPGTTPIDVNMKPYINKKQEMSNHSQPGMPQDGMPSPESIRSLGQSSVTAAEKSHDGLLKAYTSYQETMRSFLQTQERILSSFLTSVAASDGVINIPSVTNSTHDADRKASIPNTNHGVSDQLSYGPAREPAQINTNNSSSISKTIIRSEAIYDQNQKNIQQSIISDHSSNQQVANNVLTIVSERTGYPIEMISLDADLEADLGIDSIKRVEILGAIQKQLPENKAQLLSSEQEKLLRLKTLNELIASIENQIASTVSTHNIANPANATSSTKSLSVADIINILVNLISSKTGYPPEMLEINKDLEADLGIDSIKRVEIIGSLKESFSESDNSVLAEHLETLTQAKTVDSLSQAIYNLLTSFPKPEHLDAGLGKH